MAQESPKAFNKKAQTVLSGMRKDARAIFEAGLAAVAPADAIHRHCRREGERLIVGDRGLDLSAYERILVVGAGKATAAMAAAIESLLGEYLTQGLICVKYSHTAALNNIRTVEAGHPIPDANGQGAARQILDLVGQAGAKDLVILLLSGGGSALLPLPVSGVSLEEKQMASEILIGCGATIHEINAVRKHISAIKGGHLAQAALPAQVLTLILSDVVGDNLDVIASGPTNADSSTFAQCLEILERYDIVARMPAAIVAHIEKGIRGEAAETPKPTTARWQHVDNRIVGGNMDAITAAERKAITLGYQTLVLSSRMEGETRTVAQVHGAIAREILASQRPLPWPACLLSGGETTVTLKGAGLGGRNQEFALATALDIDGARHVVVLSAGTDGTDGPTDAAGAIADEETLERAAKRGLSVRRHLENNDAYPLFKKLNDLVITGPTQTNVMDLRVILVKGPGSHAS